MSRRTTLIACLLAIVMCVGSCDLLLEPDYREGDYLYLKHEGATLPVWVKGNVESGIFIVFLHGGPGRTGYTYANTPCYKEVQQQYAMVFWDQRSSGTAQGNPDASTLTLEQFVEDTDKIIDLIRWKYEVDKLFLLGKSWGGCLGTAYLLDEERQSKVTGWIEADGAHNFKDGIALARQWIIAYADSQIAAGKDTEYWEEALDWYADNEQINTIGRIMKHGGYINAANGIYLDPADDPGDPSPLFSPVPFLYLFNALRVNKHLDYTKLDFTPEMYRIVIPTLITWGRHDGTLPVALASQAFDALGTHPKDKYLVIFENSAHGPSIEEPVKYAQTLLKFIDRYK